MIAEGYLNKKFPKYRAEVALYNESVSIFGIDGLYVIVELFQKEEK